MPRKSAASNVFPLDVRSVRPKITPLGRLTKAERRIFDHEVRENPHLKRADAPLLEAFALAYCRMVAARRKGPEAWERENRILMAIGTKLRITPQSVVDPKAAARQRAEAEQANDMPRPWDEYPDERKRK